MNGWISASDMVPGKDKIYESVLVLMREKVSGSRGGGYDYSCVVAYYNEYQEWRLSSCCDTANVEENDFEVTHWMPLPEYPKLPEEI